MLRQFMRYVSFGTVMMFLFLGVGYAQEVTVEVGQSPAVMLIDAKVANVSAQGLQITGQLKRAHVLPMAGHLHSYGYAENGDLLTGTKHRVPGLNSKRKGSMRIPFTISVDNGSEAVARVLLKYHVPGNSEC